MIVFRKNNVVKICSEDRLSITEAMNSLGLDNSWEAGFCKTYIDEHFDIVNNEVVFWDMQKRFDNKVSELHPFNKVVNNEVVMKSDSELLSEGLKTLAQIKAEKLEYYSNLSMEKRREIYPDYKLMNAALDIYDASEKGKIKQKCIAFRNEYYRIKAIVDAATDVETLETITWNI